MGPRGRSRSAPERSVALAPEGQGQQGPDGPWRLTTRPFPSRLINLGLQIIKRVRARWQRGDRSTAPPPLSPGPRQSGAGRGIG